MKKIHDTVLIFLMLCCCTPAQAQFDNRSRMYDIVTDIDTFYLFSNPKPCFEEGDYDWIGAHSGMLLQEYVALDTVTVYGVAVTFDNYTGLMPATDNTFQAWLFKCDGLSYSTVSTQYYEFRPVDSVTLNRSHPRFCWFYYEDTCNKENCFTAPCYEFYFDTPQQINRMKDTFYVGRFEGMSSYYVERDYGPRYNSSLPSHIYAPSTIDPTVYDSYTIVDGNHHKRWGWAFPIIGFRCGPIQQLFLDAYTGDSAVVRWRQVEEGTLYNVRLTGEDGSDTAFVISDTTYTFTPLSDSVRYTAMVRKQCHYATSNYDTTVYGEWKTVSFGTTIIDTTIADTTGVDTVGIARPDVEGFSLVPNPTSGAVLLTAEADLTGVEVYTSAGVPFRRLPASGRTVRFDTSTWPAGTYLLTVSTAQGIVTRRLTVTR